MRTIYILPGPLSRTAKGTPEVERRGLFLRDFAAPDNEVDIRDVPYGPASIESAYEEYISVAPTAALMLEAEEEGYDAAILGCFGDPGLDAMREVCTRMLVVGPAEASCYGSLMLGDHLGIITVTSSVVRPIRDLVGRLGIASKLAGIAVVETPVLELYDRERSLERAVAAGQGLIEHHGANVLTLGCMTMAFLDLGVELQERLGVPVLNPVRAALGTAEGLVRSGVHHSKLAYPRPPKLAATDGSTIADLLLT